MIGSAGARQSAVALRQQQQRLLAGSAGRRCAHERAHACVVHGSGCGGRMRDCGARNAAAAAHLSAAVRVVSLCFTRLVQFVNPSSWRSECPVAEASAASACGRGVIMCMAGSCNGDRLAMGRQPQGMTHDDMMMGVAGGLSAMFVCM